MTLFYHDDQPELTNVTNDNVAVSHTVSLLELSRTIGKQLHCIKILLFIAAFERWGICVCPGGGGGGHKLS